MRKYRFLFKNMSNNIFSNEYPNNESTNIHNKNVSASCEHYLGFAEIDINYVTTLCSWLCST